MDKAALMQLLDSRLVGRFLFYPRKQGPWQGPPGSQDHKMAMPDGTVVGGRFYLARPSGPHILYFHGNGEIAADYDDIGPMYNARGMSLLAVDYRGYGKSGGEPSVSRMLSDARVVFTQVKEWLASQGRGHLWVMGRSLGSASALEIADAFPGAFSGLVIESGFAHTLPLLMILGLPVHEMDASQMDDGISNLAKISRYTGPTLVIHAEHDHIISLAQGEDLFEHAGAAKKSFYMVRGANHNDILLRDLKGYMDTLEDFVKNDEE